MSLYFDFRGNESLNFYPTERITDIRPFDNKTIILDTMYITNKGEFSKTYIVNITPDTIQYIKRNLLKNQTNIEKVKKLSEELYNIIKEVYKK